jgi:RNA polymerase sigma-70 factor, ECF subfamily
MADSDQDDAAQAGEEFVGLLLAHEGRIYSFLVSLLPQQADADDLMQEVGMAIYRAFSTFQPGTNFPAWAMQIAYRKVLDFRKRRSRDPLRFDSDFLEAVVGEHLAHGDLIETQLEALDGCIQKLSPRERELLAECYRANVPIKTVAESLCRPVDTVYKSLRRIRAALYDCILRCVAKEGQS